MHYSFWSRKGPPSAKNVVLVFVVVIRFSKIKTVNSQPIAMFTQTFCDRITDPPTALDFKSYKLVIN